MTNKFIREFRRRKIIRAGLTYIVSSWLIVQMSDVFLDTFDAPGWILRAVITLVLVGLPIALVFSWFFDITSEGIQRTADLPEVDTPVPVFDRRSSITIIALLTAGLVLSLFGNFRAPDAPIGRVSILVADFDNQSGNALFTGVLEDFLLVGLEVAPFVSAYPRKNAAALASTLAGTGSPTLDRKTASLVALREGVDIVIGGTVSRADDGITVTVSSISIGDQQEIFSVSETVGSDVDVLGAIVGISSDVRKKLGSNRKLGGAGDSESFAVTSLEAAAEYLKAQNLQLDRKLEEAVVHYEKALEFDPDFARAYAGLALTQQYLGNSEAATRNWEETLSRVDRLTERGRLRTLGNYYMINQGNYEKALDTYETLVEKYPADNVAKNNLAVTAFYAMDFQRALEVGRDVAKLYPGHSGYGANLALYAMYAGRFDEASEVAESVIEIDPANAYALLVLALTSAVAGDLDAAEETYRGMTALDQFARFTATEGLADLAIYRGDLESAVQIIDDAIDDELAVNATHPAAIKKALKAEVLLQMGKPDEAAATVLELLESPQGDPAILFPAAMVLIGTGNLERAESIAARMLEGLSKPRRAYAYLIRAEIAAAQGDIEGAVDLANTAVETVDLWLVRYTRANLLMSAGRAAEATADLEACQRRIGEGIAVFLNDRPSLRRIREIETAAGT
ncbi:MAG: tetratricopeptide repeat protein [Gammaproteobacteria bacterium]|nr:tetratricopeptide repeat protein [Gammaproteobacteria bacterium]